MLRWRTTLLFMNSKIHSPETNPEITNDPERRSSLRKAILMSVAVQVTIDIDSVDPARFTSDIFDSLPPQVTSDLSDFLGSEYPDDSFMPNRLLKFISEDDLLDDWLTAKRDGDKSLLYLSDDGIAQMNSIYSELSKNNADWVTFGHIVERTAPTDNSY